MARIDDLPVGPPRFTMAYRLVSSRYPPVGIFDQLVDADELDTLHAIEARTNDRLSDDLGLLGLVEPGDRIVGAGTTPVMAAFTHPNPDGSRFSDGRFGVYYCAASSHTAIRESAHHRARFLRATKEAGCQVEMRQYIGKIQRPLHDGLDGRLGTEVLDPESYAAGQALGAALRQAQSWGLSYPSVRDPGGQCAALFRPPAMSAVRQSKHFSFHFDGQRIVSVVELGKHTHLP